MSGAAQVPAQQKRKLEDFLQPTAVVSKLPRAERRSPVSGADDSGDSDGDDGKISFADFLAMEHDDLAYEAVRLAERCATLEAEAQQAKKAAKIASAAAVAPAQRVRCCQFPPSFITSPTNSLTPLQQRRARSSSGWLVSGCAASQRSRSRFSSSGNQAASR